MMAKKKICLDAEDKVILRQVIEDYIDENQEDYDEDPYTRADIKRLRSLSMKIDQMPEC